MEALIVRRGGNCEPYRKIIDTTSTYTVPQTGKYRIVAIGKGGNGYSYIYMADDFVRSYYGGAGGGGYIEKWLVKGATYAVTISASVSSFGSIISATVGNTIVGQSDTNALAGSVSGVGVTPFASNGTITNSISPPAMYASESSFGGGAYDDSGGFSAPAKPGGSGLFGSDGGSGTKPSSTGSWTYGTTVSALVFNPSRGGGAGGIGKVEYSDSFYLLPGGGGGGGYGGAGGGGAIKVGGGGYITNGGHGLGGGGCVFLERIG